MVNSNKKVVIALTFIFLTLSAIVTKAAGRPYSDIRQTLKEQQLRIHEGVASGQLTRRETAKLELQQARILTNIQMAKSDGVVTRHERKRIIRQQVRASESIYVLKHNNIYRACR